MLKQVISEQEAIDGLREMVQKVFGKRWMVVVWEVEEDAEGRGTLGFVGRMSWKFPVGDFPKCVEMLKADLERETEATLPLVPPPLDTADWLKAKEISTDDDMEEIETDGIDKLFNPTEGE